MKARTLKSERVATEDGGTLHMVIYDVGKSEKYPQGVQYRLYFIREGEAVVGFDNHYPKGHHRHVGGREEPYAFESVERLVADFLKEAEKAGGKVK